MAVFVTVGGDVKIISNNMSIVNAGFRPAKSYYDHSGATLSYFVHESGQVVAKISRRRRQPFIKTFASTTEANADFKRMNEGLTFQTGKWVPEKKR